MSADTRPRVIHHGPANLGPGVTVDCAVLADGRRGYVQRSLRQAIGIKWNMPVPSFVGFCGEIAPNSLSYFGKTSSGLEVVMPNGATGLWVEMGILTALASGVLKAALGGTLRANRQHLVAPCLAIIEALGTTGEAALIDEATGYQYHREPDALQDLFSLLIRQSASDWERRFPPDYYAALCRLFGFKYGNKHRPLPHVVSQITLDWVYLTVFPPELVAEIKARRKAEKLHQWLTANGGLQLLERQRDAVTALAKSSVDYADFKARCTSAFPKAGQQVIFVWPEGRK
ncbi:P63C domain-containing protein [Xanthobacter sediminis]